MTQNGATSVTLQPTPEVVSFINTTQLNDEQILRRIESLSVSADAKALLADLSRLATRVGQTMLRVGRKILDFILSLVRAFPHLTFAALLAVVLTALIGMVPLVGVALASMLGPLALALGVAVGGVADFQSPDLAARVREFASAFSELEA